MSLDTKNLDPEKLTPMMQQYLAQKEQWPDSILFFRLGDFYELFFEDALTAARELELTLTGRECGLPEKAPMCGVPHHAADNYINRLINRGYKVAICDQVEDPAQAKGIVRREVVRVITPGTITDASILDEKRNNYILAVYKLNLCYGLAACDLTTGSFTATALITGATAAKLQDEIARYAPSEILHNTDFQQDSVFDVIKNSNNIMLTLRPDEDFSLANVDKLLPPFSGQQPLWSQAAVAILVYLEKTQRVKPDHLKQIEPYSLDLFMNLDPVARRNLEITESLREKKRHGSLIWAVDRTVTAAGSRLLRRYREQPLLNCADINQRQAAIADLKEQFMRRQELRECLDGLYDLERLSSRLALGQANARDLVSLRLTLARLPAVKEHLSGLEDGWLVKLHNQVDDLPQLRQLLEKAILDEPAAVLKEGNLIRPGYHEEVDRLKQASTEGKQWIIDLEKREREKTGIKSLKVSYNNVFGYYIDVTKANLGLVPEHYQRKQTLANSERYITEELKEMEDTIVGAEQKLLALEYDVFCQVREIAAGQITSLQLTAEALATVDVLAGLAELADRENYCRPIVDLSDRLYIKKGRHPVVEKVMPAGSFVPNDIAMDMSDNRLMLLTGPNMAGKSTYMRQAALIVLLAQTGSFVPADQAHIGLVDRIFTRIGASDDLAGGQSTFMVEMNEVAHILEHASDRSLLILDEIGRGTSTYDGLSIAWSVIEYVVEKENLGCRTLFATHYHELTDLAGRISGTFNNHVAVSEEDGEVVFLHQIRPGSCDDSYGIEVARLAGVPDDVVVRAREILSQLEAENGLSQQARIKRSARPMDGQIDLFSASQALKKTDEIIEELGGLDITQLTPLDALNVLSRLQKKAGRKKRSDL